MGQRGIFLGVAVRIGAGLLAFSVRTVVGDGFVLLPGLLVLACFPGSIFCYKLLVV